MSKLTNIGNAVRTIDMRTTRPLAKVAESFYLSPAWVALRRDLIRVRGYRCQGCGKSRAPNGKPIRLIGDHVVERKDGGADLDPGNVRLVCLPCHNAKTATARGVRLSCA